MNQEIASEIGMVALGKAIGSLLSGGEIIELTGDVGTGKTTLVKGVASGLGVDETVQSPSFTISRVYHARDGLILAHYDFYRLDKAGIMAEELHEKISDNRAITVIEWGQVVEDVLPTDRITINIRTTQQDTRIVEIKSGGQESSKLLARIKS